MPKGALPVLSVLLQHPVRTPLLPQSVVAFLLPFGLRPLTNIAVSDVEFASSIDDDCCVPVTLVPLTDDKKLLTPSTDIPIFCDDADTSYSAVSLSSALESLPADAPLRFRKLLRLFPLPLSYPGLQVAREAKAAVMKEKAKAKDGGKQDGEKVESDEEEAEISVRREPEWHLLGDGSAVTPY
jgi:hypothetical protein